MDPSLDQLPHTRVRLEDVTGDESRLRICYQNKLFKKKEKGLEHVNTALKYVKLHSIWECSAGQSGAFSVNVFKTVSRGNMKFRQRVIRGVTLGGTLTAILTCP